MLADYEVLLFGSLSLFLFLLHRIWRVKQDWQAFRNLPAHFVLVSPIDALGRVLPHIPRVSDGMDWCWRNVYESQPPSVRSFFPAHDPCLGVFTGPQSDIIQIHSLFPSSTPCLILADATATKVRPVSAALGGDVCAQFVC